MRLNIRRIIFSLMCVGMIGVSHAAAQIHGDLPRVARPGFLISDENGQLVVSSVETGSAAGSAGLTTGDVIVAVNGTEFSSLREGHWLISQLRTGDLANLHLLRQGRDLTISFKPDPVPLESISGVNSIYDVLETEDGGRLRIIVTRPTNVDKRLPAILFVQWLSCDSIELPHNVNDGWQQMIRLLAARSGFVMLRTDKAGIGDSEGPPCWQLDYNTELSHHRQAFYYLRTLDYVDADRIVIFGASMGGNMAPILAAEDGVSAMIIWGTTFKTWFEHLIAFNRRVMQLSSSISPVEIAGRVTRQIQFLQEYLVHSRTPSDIAKTDPELGAVWQQLVGTSQDTHYGRPFAFHHQAQKQNWLAALHNVQVPTLILYGEYDWIEELDDHVLAAQIINQNNGPGTAELIVIPRSDHHFSVYASLFDSFIDVGGIIAPQPAVVEIVAWLSKLDGS